MVTKFNVAETPLCYLCWMVRLHDHYCKRKNRLKLFKMTTYVMKSRRVMKNSSQFFICHFHPLRHDMSSIILRYYGRVNLVVFFWCKNESTFGKGVQETSPFWVDLKDFLAQKLWHIAHFPSISDIHTVPQAQQPYLVSRAGVDGTPGESGPSTNFQDIGTGLVHHVLYVKWITEAAERSEL